MNKIKRRPWAVLFLIFGLLFAHINVDAADAASSKVYVISVEKAVEAGLSKYMERAISQANNDPDAAAIVIEIDTPGGVVTAAQDIRQTIENASAQTAALVKGGAISAGTYIAMSCDMIAMQPGTTIGDVEPRVGNERADEKVLSAWKAEMAALAEAHGRDKDIARAMVDRDMVLEGIKEAGQLLTLTAQEAYEVGYADYLVADRAELLRVLGLAEAEVVEVGQTRGEEVARFLTSPYVAPILLMIGMSGIAIEIFTAGFGVAGAIGIVSLALYFWGHLFAGFTGWATILLFLAGIILLLVEITIPGFGVFGIAGIISLAAGIIITAPSMIVGLQSLVIAIVGTWVLLALALKYLTKRQFWSRLVLSTQFNKEKGYISQSKNYQEYLGQKARTITDLRPAGIVSLEDGTRLDVVSEGGFVEKDQSVKIIKIDGPRIVVVKIAE